jgi:hypothetical protein
MAGSLVATGSDAAGGVNEGAGVLASAERVLDPAVAVAGAPTGEAVGVE